MGRINRTNKNAFRKFQVVFSCGGYYIHTRSSTRGLEMTICKVTASICRLRIRRDITKEQISKVGDWTKDFPQEKSTESNRYEREAQS